MLTFKQLWSIVLFLALASGTALAKGPVKSPEKGSSRAEIEAQTRLLEHSFASRRFAEAHRIQWMTGIEGHCGELVNGVMIARNPVKCRGWHPPRLELRNGDCIEIAPGEIVVGTRPQAVCAAHFAATFRWEGADCAQWIDGVRRGFTPELDRCRESFPTSYVPDHEFCMEITPGGAFIGYSNHSCGAVAVNEVRDLENPACTADLRDLKYIAPPAQSFDGTRQPRGSTNIPL